MNLLLMDPKAHVDGAYNPLKNCMQVFGVLSMQNLVAMTYKR